MKKTPILVIAVLSAGCASYTLPKPNDFTAAQTLAVEGGTGFKLKQMKVGEYSVDVDRGWTREKEDGGVVRDQSKQQGYSFAIKQNDTMVFTGGCMMESAARRVGAPGGIEINASESSELECEMLPKGTGRDSWRLALEGKPDRPMTGRFTGEGEYTVEGVGMGFGSTKYGPVGGYYIKQGDRTVASVQVSGKRQVLFAPGAQSDPLLAAAIALLLMDENARSVD